MTPGNLRTVFDYHERTKHHLDRYARSPGFMDWDSQPDPFRRYEGAPLLPLDLPADEPEPTYDSLFTRLGPPRPLDKDWISRLFYYSLALSAWKQVRWPDGRVRSRWSLRVDPSSGNLHPTEGYLICGPVAGLFAKPAVYHYAPLEHGLEVRRELDALPGVPAGGALVGLTSIFWREAWKYGERAYRYCQHDCGHAIGAIALAAACLGWRARLMDTITTEQLGRLLGVSGAKRFASSGDEAGSLEHLEAEYPECLLLLTPGGDASRPDVEALCAAAGSEWMGSPNRLSPRHHRWPVIEEAAEAAHSFGFPRHDWTIDTPAPDLEDRGLSAHRIIRQRRSAVAMDGKTSIGRDAFFRILFRLMPQPVPYGALPWRPAVSLALFVHRVEGLPKGLYALIRHPSHKENLQASFRKEFLWEQPEGCPAGLPFHLLVPADATDAARTVSCHQDIAADGAFSVGMLSQFEARLNDAGPAIYPRLFWETGVVGQTLYLEAEAAGVRGTGIGCFFDDAMHQILGVEDREWQSLYHFAAGGPLEDERLETVDAYAHRQSESATD